MATMLAGYRGTDQKRSAIVCEVEELRAELAFRNAQHALEKVRLAGRRGIGSPSEWTVEELSAQLALGRAEIAYEKAKLRRRGELADDTGGSLRVFTVFVPSWAFKAPEEKEREKTVEVAEATPVVQQPRSVPVATEEVTGSLETVVRASEIPPVEAHNVQLSVYEGAQRDVEPRVALCADKESAVEPREPPVHALVQGSGETLECRIVSQEAAIVHGSPGGSDAVHLIAAVACEKHECPGGPRRRPRTSIATWSRMRKTGTGAASQLRKRRTRCRRVGSLCSSWGKGRREPRHVYSLSWRCMARDQFPCDGRCVPPRRCSP